MRSIAIIFVLALIVGCSTEPAPTGSIRLEFAIKQLQVRDNSLYPVFPNPFSRVSGDTAICIQFALSDSLTAANLLVQNALGDPIANFYDTLLLPGFYTGWWEPVDANGIPLSSGLYFVTLQNGGFIDSRLINIQENE